MVADGLSYVYSKTSTIQIGISPKTTPTRKQISSLVHNSPALPFPRLEAWQFVDSSVKLRGFTIQFCVDFPHLGDILPQAANPAKSLILGVVELRPS